ncbi:tripartite tricarboxylate transporter permease [Rhizobiaceae bacterium BDR2-2]|uniref:Tripartite tricarboxylate transporter permease n=1 Tax=Ectorhizobium quercum TaxID=2965071 RepID=A0AAE3SVS4_9HYPH|nr:tripartite tricarboxylate transporter permease [Ectorhizobium quercum]MCX8997973.1 tripartite tricarboxylate transporter permease [Ectorhizobium quercum]
MLIDSFAQVSLSILQSPFLMVMLCLSVLLGIILGALPGISSTMALAIFLPMTYGMEPASAIIFLIALLVGSVFGGSISAILINIPGTPGAIVTQFDGFPMAQSGRAGHALGHALIASTLGGLIGFVVLILIAPLVAQSAMAFRSPEFTMLAVFGLVLLAFTAKGSTFAGILSGVIGLICGMVGFDMMTDIARFDFGSHTLQNGIDLIPVTIGIFGLTEVLRTISLDQSKLPKVPPIGSLFPPLKEVAGLWKTTLRGSAIGTFIGAVPAAGSAIAVAIAYAQEQRFARPGATFGKGEPAGIVAPESANSANTGGAMIPMITLGIPGDSMSAVLIGALLIHGLRPGPMLFAENPTIVGTIYAAIFFGTVLTFFIGFGLIRFVVLVMKTPTHILMAAIALLCVVGAYAIRNSVSDIMIMIAFGGLGYIMLLMRIPAAPLAFGIILGPIMEENFRRSLILSKGSWSIFIERPVSATLIVITLATILLPLLPAIGRKARMLEDD